MIEWVVVKFLVPFFSKKTTKTTTTTTTTTKSENKKQKKSYRYYFQLDKILSINVLCFHVQFWSLLLKRAPQGLFLKKGTSTKKNFFGGG